MFVGLWAKKDFAPVGAKPSFRTYGAGGGGRGKSGSYKHFAPNGAKAAHGTLNLTPMGLAPALEPNSHPSFCPLTQRTFQINIPSHVDLERIRDGIGRRKPEAFCDGGPPPCCR